MNITYEYDNSRDMATVYVDKDDWPPKGNARLTEINVTPDFFEFRFEGKSLNISPCQMRVRNPYTDHILRDFDEQGVLLGYIHSYAMAHIDALGSASWWLTDAFGIFFQNFWESHIIPCVACVWDKTHYPVKSKIVDMVSYYDMLGRPNGWKESEDFWIPGSQWLMKWSFHGAIETWGLHDTHTDSGVVFKLMGVQQESVLRFGIGPVMHELDVGTRIFEQMLRYARAGDEKAAKQVWRFTTQICPVHDWNGRLWKHQQSHVDGIGHLACLLTRWGFDPAADPRCEALPEWGWPNGGKLEKA